MEQQMNKIASPEKLKAAQEPDRIKIFLML